MNKCEIKYVASGIWRASMEVAKAFFIVFALSAIVIAVFVAWDTYVTERTELIGKLVVFGAILFFMGCSCVAWLVYLFKEAKEKCS